MKTSRRDFIRKTTLITTGIGFSSGIGLSQSVISANDKINVGLIGCRNQGFSVLKHMLQTAEVNCLGLCDIDQPILEERLADVKKEFQQTPKVYGDFRKMLEDKEIDAVIVGTPDHWHCLQTILSCQAGKDVYVEKPLANSIYECDLMVNAAQRYNRVIQVGQQQRSGEVWQGVMDYIKAEQIGTLRKVNIWANFNYGIGTLKQEDQPVPTGVNYDFWLGPAPDRTFNETRFHGNWRHFWDYGGGLMTDWGVHLIDMALWAKDITSEPKEVLVYGNNLSFKEYNRETYDTMSVIYPMDDYVINWQHTAGSQTGPYNKLYGVEFVGDRATVVADRRNWSVKLDNKESTKQAGVEALKFKREDKFSDMENHVRNFIDCVRSRKETNCPIETGKNVAFYAHMANIGARTDSGRLIWEDKKQSFLQNDKANALIKPEYRSPWEYPQI
jgi:predicted dehydrogenase